MCPQFGSESDSPAAQSSPRGQAADLDDAALRRARQVVGLYGDPDSTWGIAVELGWSRPVEADAVAAAWPRLSARFPHLGAPDRPRVCPPEDFDRERELLTAARYLPGEPPVRVLLSADGHRMQVAAHHGAVDGLGLLAVAAGLTGRAISSAAQGIGERPARHGFVLSSARRLVEAVLSPPGRFPGAGSTGDIREDLRVAELPPGRQGSAALSAAVLAAQATLGASGATVLLLGASRRPGSRLAPDRDTAYLRLRAPRGATAAQLAELLRVTPPEPAFPETAAGGIGPWVTRLLRSRLGSTALISNLGVITGEGLRDVAMFPAPSGPRAVALGLASTERATRLTLRTQRCDFTEAESAAIFDAIGQAFTAGASGPSQ